MVDHGLHSLAQLASGSDAARSFDVAGIPVVPRQSFAIASLAHMQAPDQAGHCRSALILRYKDTFSIMHFSRVPIDRLCTLLD
jgi:hypothetical protein